MPVFTFFLFAALAWMQPRGPVFTPDTASLEYGTISYASDGTKEFWFTNTGDAPLIIIDCKTSCGCLVPYWPKEPIAPGKREKITLKYDTQREGVFNKTFTVHVNEVTGYDAGGYPDYAMYTYRVNGTVSSSAEKQLQQHNSANY